MELVLWNPEKDIKLKYIKTLFYTSYQITLLIETECKNQSI